MNIFTWIITLAIVVAPVLANSLIQRALRRNYIITKRSLLLPILCGVIYPVSRFLPEPHITNESITLAQHFIGGGFISALYFIYLIREQRVHLPASVYIALLYPFVSMMGVTNELLEFTATKLGIYALDGTDTWWDLLANTAGAYALLLTLFAFMRVVHRDFLSRSNDLKFKK
jgi:hypothetical protein